jgi:hypothetical protein
MVFPLGSHLADIRAAACAMPTPMSACIASSAGTCAKRSSGPISRRRSASHRPPSSCARWASFWTRPRTLHRARKAHDDQAAVGSVALGHAGFLRHGQLRHRRQRDLRTRHPQFPRRRHGPALRAQLLALRRRQDRQRRVRAQSTPTPPLVMFGSYNERMYMAEMGSARTAARPVHPGQLSGRASAATPARPSWATPARPILFRKCATPVRCAVPHPAARHRSRQGRTDPALVSRARAGGASGRSARAASRSSAKPARPPTQSRRSRSCAEAAPVLRATSRPRRIEDPESGCPLPEAQPRG